MQDGSRVARRRGRRSTMIGGVVGLAIASLMLAACTSGGSASGSTGAGGPTATTNSGPPVVIAITPAANTQFNPNQPIVVKATNGKLSTVTVTNASTGAKITGDFSTDMTSWTSNEDLAFGASYSVDANGANPGGSPTEQKATVSTIKPAKQTNANMVPGPSSVASTGIGVGEPIAFQFDDPVVNKAAVQAALTVTTTPSQTGGWYWVSSTQVDYRGQDFWTSGSTIHVVAKLYGLDFGGGVYGGEDRDETYHVHDALIAKADGNTSQMQIYDNGSLVNTLPISMGKDSTPTHLGTHVISQKAQTVNMNSCTYGVCSGPQAYNVMENWAERISNDGEFVHENPNSDAEQGHSNVSHGCINLNLQNAQWFFNKFGIGDVVEVTNSGGQQLQLGDTWGDWSVPWSTWQAGNA